DTLREYFTTTYNNNSNVIHFSACNVGFSRNGAIMTTASSYVFAPSWLTNKSGSSSPSTILSPAYSSSSEGKSTKEEANNNKGSMVGRSLKKDGLSNHNSHNNNDSKQQQGKDGLGKDGSSSSSSLDNLTKSSLSNNGNLPLTSTIRSKTREFTGSAAPRTSNLEESTGSFNESISKNHHQNHRTHSRSRTISQPTNSLISSSSSSSTKFEREFPTLAKKKPSLSIDLSSKNVENLWGTRPINNNTNFNFGVGVGISSNNRVGSQRNSVNGGGGGNLLLRRLSNFGNNNNILVVFPMVNFCGVIIQWVEWDNLK
ncbi:7721_t:CDS:2, partial [Entrophospora sp. SA101]